MLHTLLLTIILSVFLVTCTFASSPLLNLTPSTLPSHLSSTHTPTLIAFIAPWCGHCQRAKPELEKAAQSLAGVVHVATVDCEAHRDVCAQYGIQGFPTIKLLRNNGKDIDDYNGARQAKALVDFAMFYLNQMRDVVRKVSVDALQGELASQALKIVLLTNKQTNPTMFKSLALEFADEKGVEFLFLPEADKYLDALRAVAPQVNIEKVPAIVALRPMGDADDATANIADRIILYTGNLKKYDLMDWVKAQIKEQKPAAAAPQDAVHQQQPLKQQIPKLRTLESQEDIDKHCQKLCILGFTDGSDEQRELLSQIAKKHNDHGFPFLLVPAQKSMAQQFGLEGESKLSLVALRVKRKKMFKSGPIESEADAAPFLDRIAYGDAKYEKLTGAVKFTHDEL